jgi:hypothetical protein
MADILRNAKKNAKLSSNDSCDYVQADLSKLIFPQLPFAFSAQPLGRRNLTPERVCDLAGEGDQHLIRTSRRQKRQGDRQPIRFR